MDNEASDSWLTYTGSAYKLMLTYLRRLKEQSAEPNERRGSGDSLWAKTRAVLLVSMRVGLLDRLFHEISPPPELLQ